MKKTGVLIVPTGIGASIGGFAGDASCIAREFSKYFKLIVNPNVVNAACFSGINEEMLYVEGFSLDEFFKNKLALIEAKNNKIGVIFDKSITQEVLNIHINTINAVKVVYGIDILGYELTKQPVEVDFFVDKSDVSTGGVKNIETIIEAGKKLLKKGAQALAVVCAFSDCEDTGYENGIGVDPIGGVEAIISHYISKELKVPAAHAPAFENFSISPKIVDKRASAEYITPTFLPCILIGLSNAPLLSVNLDLGISVKDLSFLVMPYDSLGSVPVFEALKRGIKVFAINENKTVLDIDKYKFQSFKDVVVMNTYSECLDFLTE